MASKIRSQRALALCQASQSLTLPEGRQAGAAPREALGARNGHAACSAGAGSGQEHRKPQPGSPDQLDPPQLRPPRKPLGAKKS